MVWKVISTFLNFASALSNCTQQFQLSLSPLHELGAWRVDLLSLIATRHVWNLDEPELWCFAVCISQCILYEWIHQVANNWILLLVLHVGSSESFNCRIALAATIVFRFAISDARGFNHFEIVESSWW
jgi:hypothetical protein